MFLREGSFSFRGADFFFGFDVTFHPPMGSTHELVMQHAAKRFDTEILLEHKKQAEVGIPFI